MKKATLFLLFVLLFSGCTLGNINTSDTTNIPQPPPIEYNTVTPFKVSDPNQDMINSTNITKKAAEAAKLWQNNAQLAGLSITYDTITESANKTGTYVYISDNDQANDQANVFQIVFRSGQIDKPQTVIANRIASGIKDTVFASPLPLDKWKITSAKALEIADTNGGSVARGMTASSTNPSANTTLEIYNNQFVWNVSYNDSAGQLLWKTINAETGEVINPPLI
jgi:hypothetical protein